MSTLEVKKSTVKKAIDKIENKEYFLHAIQRDFVWNEHQITSFFDSLLLGYHLGAFLFWRVRREKVKEYKFYEFLTKYDAYQDPEKDINLTRNKAANIKKGKDIKSIMDGQQRLTALYLGLKGSYASKLKGKRKNDPYSYPERFLYLNLFSDPDNSSEEGLKYSFEFREDKKSQEYNDKEFWFKVGNILDSKLEKAITKNPNKIDIAVEKYFKDKHLPVDGYGEKNYESAFKIIGNLYKAIYVESPIHYFLESEQDLDKVLYMFIRLNSGGTRLSYPDLLLSVVTAQWDGNAGKEKVNDLVDRINKFGSRGGFNISKNNILKGCLALVDKDIKFRTENFQNQNIQLIKKNWSGISKSMMNAVRLIDNLGYSRLNFFNYNPLISIAYYLNKKGDAEGYITEKKHETDRRKIFKWLILVILSKTFGGGRGDKALREMRKILGKSFKRRFPLAQIKKNFGEANLPFLANLSAEGIKESFLKRSYGDPHTYSVLSCIYLPPKRYSLLEADEGELDKDHIFPRSKLLDGKVHKKLKLSKEDIEFYCSKCDSLANLQLLPFEQNSRKQNNSFKEWLEGKYKTEKERKAFKKKHLIPLEVDLDEGNFRNFITKREELLIKKFEDLCKIDKIKY